LFIDDQEKQISSVEIRSQPVNIILLLDTSPSAEMRVKEIQQYAIGIIEQLPPDDKMMVVSFNQDDRVLIDLTDDRKLLTKAINKWPKGDGTSLYDTITNIFRNRLEQIPGRKAVILLTDGIDTTSRKASYVSSLVEAEKGDAPVYPVYFDTLQETKNKIKSFPYAVSFPGLTLPSGQPQLSPEEESEIGKLYLNDLTNLSGGRAITYENVKSGKQRITIGIPQELRNQYIITFTPAGIAFAEQHRKVRVRVNRPNLVVVTRGSYIQQPPTQPKN
jgi:VWFA-related protein